MSESLAQSAAPPARPKALPRQRKKRRETFTIGFRVDTTRLQALEERAASVGVSVHEMARILVYSVLENEEGRLLLESRDQVRGEVRALREDIARSLEVVLLNTTKGSAEQIRSWVDENLRR